MNNDILKELYEIIEQRKIEQEEGSYTVYLFNEGLDKILKKLGEESAETIIAAKNLADAKDIDAKGIDAKDMNKGSAREALIGETGDLIYHLVVMLNELGVDPDEVGLLRTRMRKRNNLKESRK